MQDGTLQSVAFKQDTRHDAQQENHTLWRRLEQNTRNTHAYAIRAEYNWEDDSALALMQGLHCQVLDLPQKAKAARFLS